MWVGQKSRCDEAEFQEAFGQITHELEQHLQRAYRMGHADGVQALLAQLPDSVKAQYEFEPELDKFWAEKRWQKHKQDGDV